MVYYRKKGDESGMEYRVLAVGDVVGEPLRGESASLTFRPWENKFIKLAW